MIENDNKFQKAFNKYLKSKGIKNYVLKKN